MPDTLFPALMNALLYTAAGLAVFAASVALVRRMLPTDRLPEALLAVAAVLGAAIVIAAAMH